MGEWILVRSANRTLGVAVSSCIAVLDPGDVTSVPSREPAFLGVAEVSGELLPVLHLGMLLGEGSGQGSGSRTALLVRCGQRRLCLEVDTVDDVLRGSAMQMPPNQSVPWAHEVLRHDAALVPLIDIEMLAGRLQEMGVV